MYHLAADWFIYTVLLLQLFYQIGDNTVGFGGYEVPAKWVFCPVLFVGGIVWKYRRYIHDRIIKKRTIHEPVNNGWI